MMKRGRRYDLFTGIEMTIVIWTLIITVITIVIISTLATNYEVII